MPAVVSLPASIWENATATSQKLLYFCDHHFGRHFLVDMGAEVSVIPPPWVLTLVLELLDLS